MKMLVSTVAICLALLAPATCVRGDDPRPILEFTDLFRLSHCPGPYMGWFFSVDASFLTRAESERVFLAQVLTTAAPITKVAELSTDDASFSFAGGVTARAGFQWCSEAMLEGSYSGPYELEADSSITNTQVNRALSSPFLNITGVGTVVPAYNTTYSSTLQAGDVNIRFLPSTGSWWNGSTLVGIRYFNLHETFTLGGTQFAAGVVVADETTSAETTNQVILAQVGGDIGCCCGRFSFWLFGNAGLGANFAEQEIINVRNTPAALPLTRLQTSENSTSLAGLIQLGGLVSFQITDYCSVHAGYQAMLITGLALAPEQLNANDSLFENTIKIGTTSTNIGVASQINASGVAVYHGPSVGAEVRW